jgi:hypothetical protein
MAGHEPAGQLKKYSNARFIQVPSEKNEGVGKGRDCGKKIKIVQNLL